MAKITLPELQKRRINLREKLNELIDKSLATGNGFSMDRDRQHSFEEGFAVMVTDFKLTAMNRADMIEQAIDFLFGIDTAFGIFENDRIVGLWVDGKDVFFDFGMRLYNLEFAVEQAQKYEQRAIFSFCTQEVIEINEKW